VSDQPPEIIPRGLLDTSVVVSLDRVVPGQLPAESAIAAMTLAELAAGPHATDDEDERARRQDRLQRVEAMLDPLPFDAAAARAYGRIYAATRARRRKPRGARAVDLMIAAVALANDLPLFTCNPDDFEHLEEVGLKLQVVERTESPRY
jgi:predicted nucleic acid-binding protein